MGFIGFYISFMVKDLGLLQDIRLNFPVINFCSLKYSNSSEGHHSFPSENPTPESLSRAKVLALSDWSEVFLIYIDRLESNENPRDFNRESKVWLINWTLTCFPSALVT